MIDYSKEQWGGTLHLIGSVLPRSIPQALISVAVVFAVVAYARFVENTFARTEVQTPIGAVGDEVIYEFAEHPYVHQMGMLSISFVIAFRVNLAYNRCERRAAARARAAAARHPLLTRGPRARAPPDWEGLTMVHSMRSKWVDAITQLLAFDDPISLGPHPENTTGFKVMIAHLFSLLHAVAMLEIKGVWDVRCLISRRPEQLATPVTLMTMMFPWLRTFYMHEENRHRYIQMEVLGGVDERALDQLLSIGDHGWVEFVHARIIRVICDRMTSGGLNFPPPIISRIFQEISTGTLMSASAQKIAQVPFPWPFFDVMRLIKYYFLLTGPLVIVSFTTHVSVAVFLSFLSSLFFVAINEVAEELEDPFGEVRARSPRARAAAEWPQHRTAVAGLTRLTRRRSAAPALPCRTPTTCP